MESLVENQYFKNSNFKVQNFRQKLIFLFCNFHTYTYLSSKLNYSPEQKGDSSDLTLKVSIEVILIFDCN